MFKTLTVHGGVHQFHLTVPEWLFVSRKWPN